MTVRNYFSWRNAFITAGIAFIAPYVVRRMLPLLRAGLENITAGEVGVAGRDSVRDAADDLGVGGMSGKVSRGVDRVTDHLQH